MSTVARIGTAITCIPKDSAAVSITGMKNSKQVDVSGLNMKAIRAEPGRNFPEQTKPFAAEREFEQAESGDIAARLIHARNEALRDRIGDIHEHDRHGA